MAQAPGATVKVAVLGGGVAGLAAAFELSDPRHRGRFQVTLHQLGWRLGGKCASGRDMDVALRTKEHGPHIFFGFYDNAFAILREAYAALASDPSRPFKTIEDALVAHNDLDTMEQQDDGSWLPWNIPLPPLPGQPGDPLANPQAFAYRSLIERLGNRVQALHDHDPLLVGGDVLAKYAEVKSASDAVLTDPLAAAGKPFAELQRSLRALQESLLKMPGGERKADLETRRGERKADLAVAGMSTTLGHLWILANLAAATALGMAIDGLVWPTRQSVAKVNTLEYRAWLSSHLATSETVNSAVVRAMYDTVFAYPGGDNTQSGDVEAGSAVLTQKGLVSYRGPAAWKMRTGTGDVTAAPLFQVLQQRGVQVNFFHRVDDLAPSAGGTIDTITIGVQATTPNSVSYKPLINVKGVDAWPDRPLYGRLNEGSQLSSGDYDLESFWTNWKDPVKPVELSRSRGDFDVVVLAIPVGALSRGTTKLTNPAWTGMLAGASTVVTQSMQVWLNAPTGWTVDPAPVVTGFDSTPIDTWLDGSEVIPYENWPGTPPVGMAILCGSIALGGLPRSGDHNFPAQAAEQVAAGGETLLGEASPLWPSLVGQNGFDWSALVDSNNGDGPARLNSQVFVPAINPWDQYVQTPTNNSSTRLAPDGSGYSNLFLAGDWTDYGYNLGCFEGAVMSGLMAANAITQDPRPILRDPYAGS